MPESRPPGAGLVRRKRDERLRRLEQRSVQCHTQDARPSHDGGRPQEAGSSLKDVVRVTYVLPNGAEFEQCWPVLRRYFGEVRPAAMMISAGLADPRMKIEIEVTALKGSSA